MPAGRHRGGADGRPLARAAAPRRLRDLRLPVASFGLAATMLGGTAVVATAWAHARSEPSTGTPTAAASPHDPALVTDALETRFKTAARASRDRSGPAAAALTKQAVRSVVGAGPMHPPTRRKDAASGAGSLPAGVSHAPCSISSSIEAHLTANAIGVYRAVCAAFGHTVSSFGGYRAGSPGDHGTGRAVDIMVSGDPGLAIAAYVQAHAAALHVTYVIYQQKIWLVGTPTTQWKPMEDRGSRTANHYDHVHVSVS